MAHTVIMPMLGMAQETGVIVSWLKAHGDAVRAGEPLMEVETDKATMEVEAAHDGFLADLRYGPGDTVPVGEVVAIIQPDRPGAADPKPETAAPAAPSAPVAPTFQSSAPLLPSAPSQAPAPAKTIEVPLASGRILASPKARRVALEQGLDLGRLAAAGHPQPYHVSDLALIAALPTPKAGVAVNRLTATAPPANLVSFHDLINTQTGGLPASTLWAAFASGALRAARQSDETPIVIRVETPSDEAPTMYLDADLARLADVAQGDAHAAPTLILRDLTTSPLGELSLGDDVIPVLCIASGFRLTLTWPAGSLSSPAAIAFILGVAQRIEQPLRHLL